MIFVGVGLARAHKDHHKSAGLANEIEQKGAVFLPLL
jgi:hypothetical protein